MIPPAAGTGVLEAGDDGGSGLGLTYNNVALESVGEAGGWAEVCPLAAGVVQPARRNRGYGRSRHRSERCITPWAIEAR